MKKFIIISTLLWPLETHAIPIESAIGKEINVFDGWTGQSFTLLNGGNGSLQIRHRKFGSGIYIISEKQYAVTKEKPNTVGFQIESSHFEVKIDESNNPKIFINGYELKVTYN